MSKNYGMASWRVGYVMFPANLFDAMNKVQDTNLICAPMPSQLLALEALKLGRNWVEPKVKALSEVRQIVYKALEGLGELVEFPKTQGAFYVLMKLPGLAEGVQAIEFNRVMTEKFKVASIPGFAFGLTNTQEANYQRLSYGALEAASVAEGVQRYVAAVKDWYGA
jgi:aspartate/methionine/tyrosine aminotransferase